MGKLTAFQFLQGSEHFFCKEPDSKYFRLCESYVISVVYSGLFCNPLKKCQDFPCGAVVKNPPANAGDTGSSLDPGRSHMPQSN